MNEELIKSARFVLAKDPIVMKLCTALSAAEARAVEAERKLTQARSEALPLVNALEDAERQLAAAREWLDKYRDALRNDDGAVAGGLLKELAAALSAAPAPVSGEKGGDRE